MRRAAALAAVMGVFLAGATTAPAAGRCGSAPARPWCDTSLSADQRAGLLLDALTQDERISLLAGDDPFGVSGAEHSHTGTSEGVPRVGLPPVYFSDGPVGPRQGKTTAMPVPMALAATFDPAAARSHGATIANEATSKGNDVLFAPTVNIMRTPLNGRTFEGYGEDPFLVSRLAVGWIRGAQSQGVIANIKHFAANNQEGASPAADESRPGQPLGPPPSTGSRMTVDSVVDERTLREVYWPQFEAAVKEANVGSVMCSYNRLNGQYACQNEHLLNEVLKRDWHFKGFALADYAAAHPEGTAASLNNGLDFEPWPGISYSPTQIRLALLAQQASPAAVDEHVRRILRTLFAYGFFDRQAFRDDDAQIDKPAHARTAQRIEESGITLLRNRGALPLHGVRSIAVIGADADSFKTGGGSGHVRPFSFTSPREAIARRAGSGVRVTYDDGSDADSAAAAARGAQVAVVFAGDYQTEGVDKRCLSLECPPYAGDQDGLIDTVAAANRNTIVVLETGGPVLTPWRDRVGALLEAWYPGQEGGRAIARVLFGDTGPGGRLPATFPRSEADLPTAGDPEKYPGTGERVRYKEGVLVGYRWYDAHGLAPAFPFGFGLSYTRFSYSGLRVRRNAVSVRVKNVGKRAGSDVPQLYLGLPRPRPGVVQPPRELKGFRKVTLKPGRATRVRFPLGSRAFSYWDTPAGRWAIAPGCYRVSVGRSSRDLPLKGAIGQDGFASAAARPVRRGLRFAFDSVGPVTIDVLKVSRGRRIVRTRRVKRFTHRTASFRWNGRGARLGRGWYMVRIRRGGAVRRFALERRHGKFRRRGAFDRGASCDLVRVFRLARPVFGGPRHVGLKAVVRVAKRARVKLVLKRGRRTAVRFRTRRVAGGHVLRVKLRIRTLRRGRYTLRLAARRGKTVVRSTLYVRKL